MKAQTGEFLDLLLRRAGRKTEVVSFDRPHRRQGGQLQKGLADALGACGLLGLEQRGEEVREASLVVGRALCKGRPLRTHGGQLEFFAQSADALLLQAHAAFSSSA